VLIVEDDPVAMYVMTVKIALWSLPIQTFTAMNGFEGLVKIGEIHPDLVIVDLNMPGLNGFKMLEIFKQPDSGSYDLPFIAVSAMKDTEIAAKGGIPKEVRYFPKPVDFEQFRKYITELFPTLF